MAPNKKNGKKNGDKPTKKETMGFFDKSLDEASTEGGREFYRAQIRDLEERLEKYQHKCDDLEVREKDFSSKYSHAEKEKRDMVLYLKRAVAQKEDELSDLSERLISLNQAKDAEKETFELQLSQLRQEFQEVKDKLTSENMALAGKLAALEEFRAQKEDLMAQVTSLEEQLEGQKQEHQAIIYNLERKAVLDNDRLKKEMQQHVAAVAAEFRRVSDKKMPETTMRAIYENVSVTAQIKQLSDKSKDLLDKNEELSEKEKKLQREVKVLEPLLEEMTRKSLTNAKVVHQLTEKCKQMNAEVAAAERICQGYQQLQNDHSTLQTEMKLLRQNLITGQETYKKCQAEADKLSKELAQERTLREQLENILQDAATALKDILKQVPRMDDSEVKALARRSQMLQKLLAVLDSAAVLGKGPALSEFLRDGKDIHQLEPGIARQGLFSPQLKATPRISHFKTGDLGIVPALKSNNCSSKKMDSLSKTVPSSLPKKNQECKKKGLPEQLCKGSSKV
ncbi:cilia- and flagella-associated protein 157 [Alosa sapidissima]|uniref:cilia- and flagella-associated protein 157 n=1 Tax=Alosa sapidissima TaxID=34773 RepID=UPI001C0A5D10|nr:cilia- and flagella-associated protein 157 [Alosa sapidissima]